MYACMYAPEPYCKHQGLYTRCLGFTILAAELNVDSKLTERSIKNMAQDRSPARYNRVLGKSFGLYDGILTLRNPKEHQ